MGLALTYLTGASIRYVWESNGTYQVYMDVGSHDGSGHWRSATPQKAENCNLGGDGVQGYILTLIPYGDKFQINTIQASAKSSYDVVPDVGVGLISL